MTLILPADPAQAARSSAIGRQGARFFLVGTAGTALQLGLYAATAELSGAQVASVASWLISTLLTNAAHRAVTFGVRGAEKNRSDQLIALLSCVVGLLITSLVLARLPDADGVSGVVAILVVNVIVGAARFGGLRWWLGGSGRRFGTQSALAGHAALDTWRTRWPVGAHR